MNNIAKYFTKICSTATYQNSEDKYALIGIIRKIKYRGNKSITNSTEIVLRITQSGYNNFASKEISVKVRATQNNEFLTVNDLTPNDSRLKVVVDNTLEGYKIYVKGFYDNCPVDIFMIGGMPTFIEFFPFEKFDTHNFINVVAINKESNIVEANIVLKNNWVNLTEDSYTNDCRVYSTNTGIDIYIKCKNGNLTNDTTIFTFDKFKPESDIYTTCYSWDKNGKEGIGTLYITTNGEVKIIQNTYNPIYNGGLRATAHYNMFKY